MFPFITTTWNPLGGRCPHDCLYCVTGDTLVLKADLTWEPIETIKIGERILAFSEKPKNKYWCLEIAKITAKTKQEKMVYLINTSEGEVKTTEEHHWLTSRVRWRKTLDIKRYGYPIRFLVSPSQSFKQHNEKYEMGYLSGLVEGDGTHRLTPSIKRFRTKDGKFTKNTGERSTSSYFRIALIDIEPLVRVQNFLNLNGITISIKPFVCKSKTPLSKIETWRKSTIKRIIGLCREQENEEYRRGYLAGIFDAEGSFTQHILRISNYDSSIIAKIKRYGDTLGFDFKIEEKGLILREGLREQLRFFLKVNPAIQRKKEAIVSAIKRHKYAKILSVKRIGIKPVYDITTTSKTFFANGFFSHNCWSMGNKGLVKKYNMEKYSGEIRLYEKEFKRQFKDGECVFVQDMSDLFADCVPSRLIAEVLAYILLFPKTQFLLLTKNPKRYKDFYIPPNCICGATIETTKDTCLISKAPHPFERFAELYKLNHPRKFVSIEPILDFDLTTFVFWIKYIKPEMVAIGYDNYNHQINIPTEPTLEKTETLIKILERHTKVIRKSIRKAWWED